MEESTSESQRKSPNSSFGEQYKEFFLGAKARAYVCQQLRIGGKSLSACLLEDFDKDRIVTRTYLPATVRKEDIDRFTDGIMEYPRVTEPWLYEQIATFLGKQERGLVIFEDALALREDECIQRELHAKDPSLCFCGNEVYYAVSSQDFTIEMIHDARRHAEAPYILIGAMTVAWQQCHLLDDLREMKKEDIARLARAAQAIIVRAYDGEGYIVADLG